MSLNPVVLCRTGDGGMLYVFTPSDVYKNHPNGGPLGGAYHWDCDGRCLDSWDYGCENIPSRDFPINAVRSFKMLTINDKRYYL